MSKFIDKDKVLEYIIFGVVGKDITCGELTRAIESIPTIDAVHCKDCVKGYKGNYFDGIACSIYGDTRDGYPVAVMEEDDFCSRGEKRQKDEVTKVALQTMIDWAEKQKQK